MSDWQKYIPINTELASNPANWIIVTLMVVIFGLAVSLVFHAPMEGSKGD
jgi:hypothetical protein